LFEVGEDKFNRLWCGISDCECSPALWELIRESASSQCQYQPLSFWQRIRQRLSRLIGW
jgi:hypothetical protein